MQPRRHQRLGMTLIELLVVVAILGLLVVTVLPNVANTAESRRSREAARIVSSFVAKAQSRSFGRREWSGCTFVPLGASGNQGLAAVDLYLADVPTPYRGDTTNATLTLSATTATTRTFAASVDALQMVAKQSINALDLIRFDGRGPWYALEAPPTTTGLEIRLLGSEGNVAEDLGYVSRNTPWPAPIVPHTFEIMRQPAPSGSALTIEGQRGIDLEWSGFGPPFVVSGGSTVVGTYVQFSTSGQRVSLLFDGTGRLRQIVGANSSTGSPRWVPTGPVFLLVGRTDRAGQPQAVLNSADDTVGANWQYSDSYWVAVDIMSGVCKTAECKPNATDVIDSQTYIRQALLKGGL